jgi:hypothetical protein
MPCDTRLKPRQTIQERAQEVRQVVKTLDDGLVTGRIKAKVGPQGAIAFDGLTDQERDGVTDACAFRRLLVSGSALAKAAISKAELLSGRPINRLSVSHGVHSHDGGKTWHSGH